MMSKIYDNWEKLVAAVLRREKDRQLAYCQSFSSSSSVDLSSRFNFEIPFAETFCFPTRKATTNYGAEKKLGEGRFGGVYKGLIDEQFLVAVKPESASAVAAEMLKYQEWMVGDSYHNFSSVSFFKLRLLRHPNLIKPIGYSYDDALHRSILVYEFMPKGSLYNHLFTREHQPFSFCWATRMRVVVGAATGLAFLHTQKIRVAYQILTSDDILLDDDLNPKLSNFGIARDLFTHEIEGFYGPIYLVGDKYEPYAAPECIQKDSSYRSSTTECDVYSFGVVLAELITGCRAVDMGRKDLIKDLGDKRRVLQIMDSRLKGQYPRKEAYKVANIGLQCLSFDPKSRPRMAEVLAALQKLM